MIDPRLDHIVKLLDEWCVENDIPYDVACDETDLQGVMLFKKNPQAVVALLNHLDSAIAEGNIHVETKKVRGGTILAFSLEAISESRLDEIIAEAGEEIEPMSFVDKIHLAFEKPAIHEQEIPEVKTPQDIDFLESAKNLVGESQYKTPDRGMESSQEKNQHLPMPAEEPKKKEDNKGPDRYEKRIADALKTESTKLKPREFHYALHEALDGIATPTGAQPDDLFKTFARALRVLGQRMGLGPLQDRLKEQGIAWKQSDDGQAIILTIKNATTGADQPIARISHETLQNPSDFEIQLKSMLDFATGDAPGAFEQKEKEIQDRKKAIGDIARAVQPQDEQSEVAQQMNAGLGEVATQTAAMPKPAAQPAPAAAAPVKPAAKPMAKPVQPM